MQKFPSFVVILAVILRALVMVRSAVANAPDMPNAPDAANSTTAPTPLLPVPTSQQLAWQRGEMSLMVTVGVNTFTDREWGDGHEDPAIFNPTELDTRQWVRTAKEAGFQMMVLIAKHHDGFCLWPSKFTQHSVKHSPWRGGKGDLVREFTDACHVEGMKVGLYLSPWDRNSPLYGDGTSAYNDYFVNQLTELLTQYGRVDEVWFDGANGEGPNGKKQIYDWEHYYATIRRLAPDALIAISGPDIRWVGNESGVARLGETSVQPTGNVPSGQPLSKWYPAECDVSLRPGWFYHAGEDTRVKSLAELMDIYFQSVGRNSVLLLSVPVDRRGLFPDLDVARLREFGAAVRGVNENPVTRGAKAMGLSREPAARFGPQQALDANPDTYWSLPDAARQGQLQGQLQGRLDIDLGTPKTFNVLSVGEAIALGERVRRYHIEVEQEGKWQTVAAGTVIGQRNLHAIPTTTARRLRLVIDTARAAPAIASFAATLAPVVPPATSPMPESLALDMPAKASNTYSDAYTAAMAFDGNPATRWGTTDETRACWLEVDLGQGRHFDRVTLRELTPRITRFEVQYRLNETAPWQIALTGTNAGTDFDKTFPAVMGRYVRLNILEATFAPTIFEFGIYAARGESGEQGM